MPVLKHVDFEVPQWNELNQPPAQHLGYRSLVLSMQPVGYWRLGEASGATAHDELGQHHGTHSENVLLGQPGPIVRDPNTATLYPNIGAAGTELDADLLNLRTGWSLAIWYRRNGDYTGTQNLLLKDGNDGYRIYYSSAVLYFLLRHDGALNLTSFGGTLGNDDEWHLATAVYTPENQVRTYFDGQFKNSRDQPYAPVNDVPAKIGEFFKGWLGEVTLWHHALSAEQITSLYDRGRGVVKLAG